MLLLPFLAPTSAQLQKHEELPPLGGSLCAAATTQIDPAVALGARLFLFPLWSSLRPPLEPKALDSCVRRNDEHELPLPLPLPLEVGSWPLAVGRWPLAVGSWQLFYNPN